MMEVIVKKLIYSTLAALVATTMIVACGENKTDSPIKPRNGSGQANITGSNGTVTGDTNATAATGGQLSLGSLYLNASGTGMSALYQSPSVHGGVGLNINLQSMSPTADFYKEFYNNKGGNWSYAYVEGRCRPSQTDVCGYAYYAVYIVDYNTAGTYLKIQNFGIVAAATGAVDLFPDPKSDSYLSVDELERKHPVPSN